MIHKVVGLGAGGHAKVIIEILRSQKRYELIGLLDVKRELWKKSVLGVPVLGDDGLLPTLKGKGISYFFVGLGGAGNTSPRQRLFELALHHELEPIDVIHPHAVISPSVELGKGVNIIAGATINASVRIGANAIINTGAIVEHDCVIGDGVHIASGARLASSVCVGDGAHIGIGAIVRQCISVGEDSVVGAGAVVVKDVQPRTIVMGVPACPKSKNRKNFTQNEVRD